MCATLIVVHYEKSATLVLGCGVTASPELQVFFHDLTKIQDIREVAPENRNFAVQ